MITQLVLEALFATVIAMLQGLYSLISDSTLLSAIQDNVTVALQWLYGIANFMNPIIPSSVSISIIGFYFTFYLVYFTFKFISWILRKIPVANLS